MYGYLLTPDKRIPGPYPTVIMSHGFPGYTTNNDLELTLMRMGCVVIHIVYDSLDCPHTDLLDCP